MARESNPRRRTSSSVLYPAELAIAELDRCPVLDAVTERASSRVSPLARRPASAHRSLPPGHSSPGQYRAYRPGKHSGPSSIPENRKAFRGSLPGRLVASQRADERTAREQPPRRAPAPERSPPSDPRDSSGRLGLSNVVRASRCQFSEKEGGVWAIVGGLSRGISHYGFSLTRSSSSGTPRGQRTNRLSAMTMSSIASPATKEPGS